MPGSLLERSVLTPTLEKAAVPRPAPTETRCGPRVGPRTPPSRSAPGMSVGERSANLSRKALVFQPVLTFPLRDKEEETGSACSWTRRGTGRRTGFQKGSRGCRLSLPELEEGCPHCWEGLDEDG